MKNEAILRTLQSLEFTRDLAPRLQEQLASLATVVEFRAGETIFREGAVGEKVYLIETGQVAVEIYVPGRGRVTILTVGPGQLLSWSPFFPAKPMSASGRAVLSTRAVAIHAAQLRQAGEADPALGCAIAWRVGEVIAERLVATRLQLLDIFAPGSNA